MMDYQGMYEDLLAMQRRAEENGFTAFAEECRQFRVSILMACKTLIDRMGVA